MNYQDVYVCTCRASLFLLKRWQYIWHRLYSKCEPHFCAFLKRHAHKFCTHFIYVNKYLAVLRPVSILETSSVLNVVLWRFLLCLMLFFISNHKEYCLQWWHGVPIRSENTSVWDELFLNVDNQCAILMFISATCALWGGSM